MRTNKTYIFELFKQYIRSDGNMDELKAFALLNGRSTIQTKADVVQVENLLSAIELFINKSVA